jgi:hypothetical protein
VIPASFTNDLAAGTEVDWQVEADNGAPSGDDPDSAWSAGCHFYADPSDPPAPTVTAGFSSDPAAGSQVSFTIVSNDTSADPATRLVWGLDKVPAASGPPSSQVVSLAAGQTSATVTVDVPGPGPHALYAYAVDSGGNESQWSGNDDPAEFQADADPSVTYPSFADALSAGQPSDNTMISSSASESGTADGDGNGDGNGDAFSEADLKAAGWQPGGTVTVDGARFSLPDFGTGSPDNLLAANQRVGLPAGSSGTSLVFLATSSNGDASSPDAEDLASGSAGSCQQAAPYVQSGSAVTGFECDTAGNGAGDCAVPTGAVTYADGSQEGYGLTVPNWVSGPEGPAAVAFPARLSSSRALSGVSKIYAFSVPLDPGSPVASVTLPDVGSVLSAGGVCYPALHVFGIAVANTTTATPGSSTSLASGQSWTGAWASPSEGAYAPLPGDGSAFSDQTFRIAMQASAGGSSVRLRLSDDLGWLAGTSSEPLDIGDVTVAEQDTGASVTGTPVRATFGGSDTVTIPEGGDVYTDPVDLTVTPGEYLTVSIYLSNSVPYLVQHSMCSACAEYISASGSGDETSSTTGSGFSGTGTAEGSSPTS